MGPRLRVRSFQATTGLARAASHPTGMSLTSYVVEDMFCLCVSSRDRQRAVRPAFGPAAHLGARRALALNQKRMESYKTSIEALTVDVFGTVADWYSTIVREGERLGYDDLAAQLGV